MATESRNGAITLPIAKRELLLAAAFDVDVRPMLNEVDPPRAFLALLARLHTLIAPADRTSEVGVTALISTPRPVDIGGGLS